MFLLIYLNHSKSREDMENMVILKINFNCFSCHLTLNHKTAGKLLFIIEFLNKIIDTLE